MQDEESVLDQSTTKKTTEKHSSSSSRCYLPEDYVVSDYDVLCGKGSAYYNHIGNRNFREYIEHHTMQYLQACDRYEKSTLVHSVMRIIRQRAAEANGTGFIGRDIRHQNRYYIVTDHLAREKTSQAFRDAILKQRRQHQPKGRSSIHHRTAPQPPHHPTGSIIPWSPSAGGNSSNHNDSEHFQKVNIAFTKMMAGDPKSDVHKKMESPTAADQQHDCRRDTEDSKELHVKDSDIFLYQSMMHRLQNEQKQLATMNIFKHEASRYQPEQERDITPQQQRQGQERQKQQKQNEQEQLHFSPQEFHQRLTKYDCTESPMGMIQHHGSNTIASASSFLPSNIIIANHHKEENDDNDDSLRHYYTEDDWALVQSPDEIFGTPMIE